MQLEIRLKKILQQYGLDKRGVTQRIARELRVGNKENVHRHTIGKLYRSQAMNPSLEVLGELCCWLEEHGVPRHILPQALFGERPAALWQAVAEPGTVTVYVGEYRQVVPPAPTLRWIVQHDALAMAKVVQALSSTTGNAEQRLSVRIEYVPFRFDREKRKASKKLQQQDEKRAAEMFSEMRTADCRRSSIILGSQRANHLTELMVADLFGCRPFVTASKPGSGVPFYLVYRKEQRDVPSCFGGFKPPGSIRRKPRPGIHYRSKDGWDVCPWELDDQDAGVVVIRREAGVGSLEMAAFGFSGSGTEALGEQLLCRPDPFWPPLLKIKGKEIGVYICRFGLTQDGADGRAEVHAKDVEIIPIENDVLAGHIS